MAFAAGEEVISSLRRPHMAALVGRAAGVVAAIKGQGGRADLEGGAEGLGESQTVPPVGSVEEAEAYLQPPVELQQGLVDSAVVVVVALPVKAPAQAAQQSSAFTTEGNR